MCSMRCSQLLAMCGLLVASCARDARQSPSHPQTAEVNPVERPASPVHQHPAVSPPEEEDVAIPRDPDTVLAGRNTTGEAAADAARRPMVSAIAALSPSGNAELRAVVKLSATDGGLDVTATVSGVGKARDLHLFVASDCGASADTLHDLGALSAAKGKAELTAHLADETIASVDGRAIVLEAGDQRLACGVIDGEEVAR
jgi:hypothetical protein